MSSGLSERRSPSPGPSLRGGEFSPPWVIMGGVVMHTVHPTIICSAHGRALYSSLGRPVYLMPGRTSLWAGIERLLTPITDHPAMFALIVLERRQSPALLSPL